MSEVDTKRLVLSIDEYARPNDRLDGLRKLRSVGAPIPDPLFVVDDAAFRVYRRDPAEFRLAIAAELAGPAAAACARSKKHSLALRRAYVVPGMTNPPGPRFLGLAPADVPGAIERLFQYAVGKGYDVPGADITCFFYPFIDPDNKPLGEIASGDVLPFGGNVLPVSSGCKIIATWGNNETLIRYNERGLPVEAYYLRSDPSSPARVFVARKEIVAKKRMHYTGRDGASAEVEVPITHRYDQVMADSEIVDVARVYARLEARYGPQKLEFSCDGDQIFFSESVDVVREVRPPREFEGTGELFVVRTVADVDALAAMLPERLAGTVIYATEADQSTGVNSALATRFRGTALTILFSGMSDTAHILRVFADNGHHAFPVGSVARGDYLDGDSVVVRSCDGKVTVTNLSLERNRYACSLRVAHLRGLDGVGGKAHRLSQMLNRGLCEVPRGVVLTTQFFSEVMRDTGADDVLRALLSQDPTSTGVESQMRAALSDIPETLWAQVLPVLERYGLISGSGDVIVRSSANVEDVRGESFAGAFTSIPILRSETAVRRAVIECIRSVFGQSVLRYIQLPYIHRLQGIRLAVLVQVMVDAVVSGTMFGMDASTHDPNVVVINAKRGLGQEIVDGSAAEHRLRVRKDTREVLSRDAGTVMDRNAEEGLLDLLDLLEREYAYPQDVEWSIDAPGTLWVLQSRDM